MPSRRWTAGRNRVADPPAGEPSGVAPPSARCTIISGSSTLKVAPVPGPWLAACTLPPCSSTSSRTIASPSPSPPCSRETRVGLTEPFEHVRQELRRDAGPVSLTTISTCELIRCEAHLDAAALGRELDRVRQQVPDDLLQPVGIARHRRRRAGRSRSEPEALGVGRGPHRRRPRFRMSGEIDGLHVRAAVLPETMRETSRMSSIICVSDVRVALDDRRARAPAWSASSDAIAQHPRSRAPRSAACAARATASRETRPSADWRRSPAGRRAHCRSAMAARARQLLARTGGPLVRSDGRTPAVTNVTAPSVRPRAISGTHMYDVRARLVEQPQVARSSPRRSDDQCAR